MIKVPEGDLDLLAIGEILVDLISVEETNTLVEANRFVRHQGGSPANIAVNMTKLGAHTGMIARVGDDAFGRFLRGSLSRAGVETSGVTVDPEAHTSLVFVSHTAGTPDFLACRAADFCLSPADVDEDLVRRARIVHTSMWPLSKEPSRSGVARAFQIARSHGALISLDPNYSPRIWPDRDEALHVLAEMLGYATITKPSLDDARRIFDAELEPEAYIARFHDMGPEVVVFTMGSQGVLLSEGGTVVHIPAHEIEVVDATGAGDAFWAGFLTAILDGYTPEQAAYVARVVVEEKLTHIGPLPDHMDRCAIYEQAGLMPVS
ncbi:MAG: carbohydrate kinase family protein [Anaerolineae bacterium]